VWRVDGSWDAQTYATGVAGDDRVREERVHGGLALTDWLHADLRYEVGIGIDSWDGARRTGSIGGLLERRLLADRVAIAGHARAWNGFRTAGLSAHYKSATGIEEFVHVAAAGIDAASSGAPLALWPGAGAGQARSALLRAHPLLDDGVVRGPAFGRRLTFASVETQRWLTRPALLRVAVAGFVDAAHASNRLAVDADGRVQFDVGVGLRVRVPGRDSMLRLDYGRGLRDGANALTTSICLCQ
jgi:hypothetical protein